MPLSKKEVDELLRLVGATADREINCDECLAIVAEFADRAVTGRSIPEGLKAVEHHLSVCSECQEEYAALQRALDKMKDC